MHSVAMINGHCLHRTVTVLQSCKTLSEEFNRRIKKYADPKLTTICSAKNEEKNRYGRWYNRDTVVGGYGSRVTVVRLR